MTKPQLSTFNDIDPTAWVEMDENGEEHRYLAWGNGMFFMCELNEDMISVKDMNGDGEITSGTSFDDADIMYQKGGIENYTEAPWLYRRSDEQGNYYGDYYLFYAYGWRECMAYATAPDLTSGDWTFGNVIMYPTSTSNTNHMAVFDFKGRRILSITTARCREATVTAEAHASRSCISMTTAASITSRRRRRDLPVPQ